MSRVAHSYNVCGLRPRLDRFAHAMEAVLRQHDDRGRAGWVGGSPEKWLKRLREETDELAAALEGDRPGEALQECCDVANFAMMCFDAIVSRLEFGRDSVTETVGPMPR